MFDFLIALFGGLYYGGKIASDRAFKQASDQRFRNYQALDAEIRRKVEATYEEERAIKERLLCGKYADEIYDELHDDLVFIFGDVDLRRKFYIPNKIRFGELGGVRSNTYWAFQLLLAHQGKISSVSYSCGFPLGGIDDTQERIKLCQRIEYNLQKHHSDLRLVLNVGVRDDERKYNPCAKNMILEHKFLFVHRVKDPRARLW